MVAAHLAVERTDEESVEPEQADQDVAHDSAHRPGSWAEHPFETTVKVGAEFRVRRRAGRRQSADDERGPRWQRAEAGSAQLAEPALHTVPHDGVADDPAHDEADARDTLRLQAWLGIREEQMHDHVSAAEATTAAGDTAQIDTAGETVLRR